MLPLINTDKDKCQLCYACVRVCPVKAISVNNEYARVIEERCIGCGYCVTICSQNAKSYRSSIEITKELLKSDSKIAAIVDPSIPGEFSDIDDYRIFVGMIKSLGFDYVNEASFGADLIAYEYSKFLKKTKAQYYIIANCPSIVSFVEKYHPNLKNHLANIVSPMVATAKVIHKKYGSDVKIVYIAPCISQKNEAKRYNDDGKIDTVLTFIELRKLFKEFNISSKTATPVEFDPPFGRKGSLFPISRGMPQSMNINEDLLTGNIITTDGRSNFIDAISEFEDNTIIDQHLNLMSCRGGCTMGPGTSRNGKRFVRRSLVIDYTKKRLKDFSKEIWHKNIDEFSSLNLTTSFLDDDQKLPIPSNEKIHEMLKEIDKDKDNLGCGACGYSSCKDLVVAISKGLAKKDMCLPFTIKNKNASIKKLNEMNEQLESAKNALKQSERLASMGQLSAGIAHEVNNPLGVVLMYSHILMDEADKTSDFYEDLQMIASNADRCKNILSGLLNFARKNELKVSTVNIDEILTKSLKNIVVPTKVEIIISHNYDNLSVALDENQIIQVISNLVKNAIDAMHSSGKVNIITSGDSKHVIINIKDNGPGIDKENLEKIFDPFFTTKKIGKGTGLGLAVCYGIIKMHRGQIKVNSNTDENQGEKGTEFIITLPRNR